MLIVEILEHAPTALPTESDGAVSQRRTIGDTGGDPGAQALDPSRFRGRFLCPPRSPRIWKLRSRFRSVTMPSPTSPMVRHMMADTRMTERRVLVIEDESDIKDLLRYNLVSSGYQVETAETGAH